MRDFIVMTVTLCCIWCVIHGIASKGDKKDRARWPFLMDEENEWRERAKKYKNSSLGRSSQELAKQMRRQRKLARKKEEVAKVLDRLEEGAVKAYYEAQPQRQALYMQGQINNMQQKIRDLEYESRRRY